MEGPGHDAKLPTFIMRKKLTRYSLEATIYDKRGRVLAVGNNSYTKSHPLQVKFAEKVGKPDAIFLHAEMDALRRLKDWDKAHRIVVTRFDKNGEPAIAKPCKICRLALEHAGINHIEHT